MSTKSKNDLSYFKFATLCETIGDSSDERFIVEETHKAFPKININTFTAALEKVAKVKRRFVICLDFENVGTFIDADTYAGDVEIESLFGIILKPKYPWSKVKNISLAEAELVLKEWREFSTNLKEQYEYIYNPPVRVQPNEMTQGSIERQAFSEHYGGYIEMVYLLTKGDFTKFDYVMTWDLHRFLFQAEYLLRKRDVENLK
jgi:hypothetical protein